MSVSYELTPDDLDTATEIPPAIRAAQNPKPVVLLALLDYYEYDCLTSRISRLETAAASSDAPPIPTLPALLTASTSPR